MKIPPPKFPVNRVAGHRPSTCIFCRFENELFGPLTAEGKLKLLFRGM